jgi:antitoxin component of MazEF toxin-antitoxin module
MSKHLTKHGNSLALVIEKPILDLLKIDDQTPLELSTDGDLLIVKPCRDSERDEKLREIHGRIVKRYGKVFKRLAE